MSRIFPSIINEWLVPHVLRPIYFVLPIAFAMLLQW